MPGVGWELLIIVSLILANGFFAAAEIAIIAARRGRLTQLADEGSQGARLALELARNPNRFLPTVQIGITLVGTFAAAFGGARLVKYLESQLAALPLGGLAGHSQGLALVIVVLGLTFTTVLLGELVPKRLALAHAVALAQFVALPMQVLALVGRPIVWFMGRATDLVLLLTGIRAPDEPPVSLEDIEHLIKTGTETGVLEPAEQRVALEALRMGERTARDILRPRTDIDALDVVTPPEEVLGAAAMAGYSRLPVYEGDLDHIIGFVHIKDILHWHFLGVHIELRKLLHPVLFVPTTLPIDRLLLSFQERGTQLAVVLDEFGGTEGIVTLQDVLNELVGEIRDEHEKDLQQRFVARDDSSWLVDGALSVDDLAERLQIKPEWPAPRTFNTVAGLVLAELGHIPQIGDTCQWQGLRLEVVDMDGRRIDRLLLSKLRESPATDAADASVE